VGSDVKKIDLTGEKAVVTGASTGIGRATAIALAQAGADVAIHYRLSRQEAESAAQEVRRAGGAAFIVAGDFSKPEEVRAAVEKGAQALGGALDILVNNAGSLLRRVPIEQVTAQMWIEVIELNLGSVFHATQAVLLFMKDGGRIVNVASVAAADGGGPHAYCYAAAKGGIVSLTRGLSKELARRNIRVNSISPGTIDTPFHIRFSNPERLEAIRRVLPLERLGGAEECASAILFLCSPLSSFITGEDIQVNGGQYFT
jgi:3-oxoacyl-[acyl-carrier protein] reductase